MTNNTKIILNRVKKGKKISLEEENILLNQIDNGPFTLEYASIYRQERWSEFEEKIEEYVNKFGLFSINRNYLMLYIKTKMKSPWDKIEKYLPDDLKKKYYKLMIELDFEEHAI